MERGTPEMQEVLLSVESYREEEEPNLQRLLSFYECYHQRLYDKMADLSFFSQYSNVYHMLSGVNLPYLISLVVHLEQFEIIVDAFQLPENPLQENIDQDHEEVAEALQIMRSVLEGLQGRLLDEEAANSQQEEDHLQEEGNHQEEQEQQEQEEDVPAGKRPTLRKRVALRLQRIWRSTRKIFRGISCRRPIPAP